MTLANYAFSMGYSLKGYERLEARVKAEAASTLEEIKENYCPDSGMYYPTEKIVNMKHPEAPYLMAELRSLGVEFIENGTLFRY